MKLLVTGANGFVGRAVVSEARRHGHQVVALVRSAERAAEVLADGPDLTLVTGDVRDARRWESALDDVDAVIHLAAGKGGDLYSQFGVTVAGTEQLLEAMNRHGCLRLVHVSTFSVYDYAALPVDSVLDERSPIEDTPQRRDEYAQTKLAQEALVRDFGSTEGAEVTILRPGAVYGTGNLWDAGHAATLNGVGLAIAPRAVQKLTYVDNCAAAIVLAVECPASIGTTLNIVDDDLPTQQEFAAAMRAAGHDVPFSVPLPYRMMRALADLLDEISRRWFDGRAKLPYFLMPAKLDARFRPLRYTNAEAKRVLGWHPTVGLDEALRRSR
jgi:2-alkyl-3-oxoalkanoate reductase